MQKILKDVKTVSLTFLGVKLNSVNIILMQCGNKFLTVVAGSSYQGFIAWLDMVGMHKIKKRCFGYVSEQWRWFCEMKIVQTRSARKTANAQINISLLRAAL